MAASAKMLNVSPSDFDPSRVVIYPPAETKTKIAYYRAKIYYLDEAENECEFCLQAPSQFTFGVSPVYAFEDKERTGPIKDYQVVYSMTSLKTIEEPTAEETAFQGVLESLVDLLAEKFSDESFFEHVPEAQKSMLDPSIPRLKGGRMGIKPMYEYPKVDGEKNGRKIKVPDTSKTARMYVKLLFFSGKDKSGKEYSRMDTRFYQPPDTDRAVNPLDYINVRGTLTPLFHVKEVYFGAHGKNPYGASFSLRLIEADFVPQTSGPKGRLLRGVGAGSMPGEAPHEDGGEGGEGFGDDLPVHPTAKPLPVEEFPKLGSKPVKPPKATPSPVSKATRAVEESSREEVAAGAGGESATPEKKKKPKKPKVVDTPPDE